MRNTLPRFCRLLGEKDAVSLLDSDSVAGKLVIRRKSGWVCRFCYLARGRYFLERVDSIAILIQSVHEMHGGRGSRKTVGRGERESLSQRPNTFTVHLLQTFQAKSHTPTL